MAIAELEETVAKLHEQQWELAQKLENAEGEIARGREKAAFAIKAKEIEMQNLREMSLQNSHAIKELKKRFDRQARETIENEKSEAKQLPEGKVLVTPAHPGNAQKLTETLKERGRPEVVETEIEEWRPEESQQNKVEKGVLEQGHGGNKQEGARVSPMDGEADSEQTGEQRADRVELVKNTVGSADNGRQRQQGQGTERLSTDVQESLVSTREAQSSETNSGDSESCSTTVAAWQHQHGNSSTGVAAPAAARQYDRSGDGNNTAAAMQSVWQHGRGSTTPAAGAAADKQ